MMGKYVGHLVLGACMFAALLLFGGGVHRLVLVAAPLVEDPGFMTLIGWVERLILYGDAFFLVWWAAFSTYKAIKGLHHDQ